MPFSISVSSIRARTSDHHRVRSPVTSVWPLSATAPQAEAGALPLASRGGPGRRATPPVPRRSAGPAAGAERLFPAGCPPSCIRGGQPPECVVLSGGSAALVEQARESAMRTGERRGEAILYPLRGDEYFVDASPAPPPRIRLKCQCPGREDTFHELPAPGRKAAGEHQSSSSSNATSTARASWSEYLGLARSSIL